MYILDKLISQFYCNEKCQQNFIYFQIYVSLFLVLLSLLISVYAIRKHLKYYSNPFFQDKIIMILLMAPIYSIVSYVSIIFPFLAIYLSLVRDAYEAIILFDFFYLMNAYLGYDSVKDNINDDKVYEILVKTEQEVHHLFPCNLCQQSYKVTWLIFIYFSKAKAKYFVYRCKRYILQFLIIKPGATLIILILALIKFDEEHIEEFKVFLEYLVCVSISLSLYYLVLFYHAYKGPLAKYNPLLKFLVVKMTLFFTFWQKIVLIMIQNDLLKAFDQNSKLYQPQDIIHRIENALVVFEMLILSFAGSSAYSHVSFMQGNIKQQGSMWNVLQNNIKQFNSDYRLIKPKKLGFNATLELQELGSYKFDSDIENEYQIKTNQKIDLNKKLLPNYL